MSAANVLNSTTPRRAEVARGCAYILQRMCWEAQQRTRAASERFYDFASPLPGARAVGNRLWLEREVWHQIRLDLGRLAREYSEAARKLTNHQPTEDEPWH